jgi:hypothetical protein
MTSPMPLSCTSGNHDCHIATKTSFNLNLPPLQSIISITPLLVKNSFPLLTAMVVRLIIVGGLLNREGLLVICELTPESEI